MDPVETLLDYSKNESDLLGLKIGRCNASYVDINALKEQILEGEYDVCRLRVASEDEEILKKLEQLGMPYFFSGSIRSYKTRIKERPSGDYINKNIVFEKYDGSQEQLLFDMIDGTWGDYPIGYYRTPYLSSLITKEEETDCLFNFYKSSNLPSLNPDNGFVFMRHDNQYVGFFALNKVGQHLESHIGGILAPWRTRGFFLDMQRYIKNHCINYNLSHFCFGARNENGRVQSIFQDEGYRPYSTENVYHIPALLSYSGPSEHKQDLALDQNTIYQVLHSTFSQLKGSNKEYGYSMELHMRSAFTKGTYELHINNSIKGFANDIRVFKIYDIDDRLAAWGYLKHQY